MLKTSPISLTTGRLENLFPDCLCRETIDLEAAKEAQIRGILSCQEGCQEAYIAALKDGKFSRLSNGLRWNAWGSSYRRMVEWQRESEDIPRRRVKHLRSGGRSTRRVHTDY